MGVAATAMFAGTLAAQTPPNFAGRWSLAPDPPAVATQGGGRGAASTMGSGWGSDITVTQDATTLSIEYAHFARYDMQPPMKFVYLLNGSESKNTINMGRGPQEQVAKTAWDGSKLVIETRHSFNASHSGAAPRSDETSRSGQTSRSDDTSRSGHTMTSHTIQVLWLESPTSLAVETTRSGAMGGPASTTKTTYRKN